MLYTGILSLCHKLRPAGWVRGQHIRGQGSQITSSLINSTYFHCHIRLRSVLCITIIY